MGKSWKRPVQGWGGSTRVLAHEDGKIYRGVHTEMAPVIKHVREQNDIHNSSSKKGGMGLRYMGSVPHAMLQEWCNQQGVTVDQWAKDSELKAKFMKYFNSPEFRALQAKDYQANRYVYDGRDQQLRGTDNDS